MADGDVMDQKALEREALKDLLTLPPLLAAVLMRGRESHAGTGTKAAATPQLPAKGKNT